jgi:hypothetical protein
MRLFSFEHAAHPVIEPALEWLERYWTDWQLVAGTWYSVWALLCICPMVPRLRSAQCQRWYAKALDWLPGLDAQPLTWLLDALDGAGYSADEPLVMRGVAGLLALQDENGAWQDSEYSTVETTVTALRLLHDYERRGGRIG